MLRVCYLELLVLLRAPFFDVETREEHDHAACGCNCCNHVRFIPKR